MNSTEESEHKITILGHELSDRIETTYTYDMQQDLEIQDYICGGIYLLIRVKCADETRLAARRKYSH